MDERITNARHAIASVLQVLSHTPPDKLADIYEAVYGHRIENAHVVAHASVYEKMFQDAFELIQHRLPAEQRAAAGGMGVKHDPGYRRKQAQPDGTPGAGVVQDELVGMGRAARKETRRL